MARASPLLAHHLCPRSTLAASVVGPEGRPSHFLPRLQRLRRRSKEGREATASHRVCIRSIARVPENTRALQQPQHTNTRSICLPYDEHVRSLFFQSTSPHAPSASCPRIPEPHPRIVWHLVTSRPMTELKLRQRRSPTTLQEAPAQTESCESNVMAPHQDPLQFLGARASGVSPARAACRERRCNSRAAGGPHGGSAPPHVPASASCTLRCSETNFTSAVSTACNLRLSFS